MKQHELLERVAAAFADDEALAELLAPFRFLAVDMLPTESDDVQPTARLMPSGLKWNRMRKSQTQKTHKLDFVVSGPITDEWTVAWYLKGIESVVEAWLANEPLEDALFVGAETVANGEAGYIRDSLYDTPATFLGGVTMEFYTYE